MRDFLSILIMPIPLFLVLILAGVIFIVKKRAFGKWIFLVSFLWFLLISFSPLPLSLVKNLEKDISQLQDSNFNSLPDSINVIVLGAGHSDDPSLSPNNQLSINVLGRLVEGVRIYKTATGKRQAVNGNNTEYNIKLIVSGAQGRLKTSQAEVLKKTAVILGVDSSDIRMLTRTVNTRNEAEEYIKMYGVETRLILVTDAIHMPRAVKIFTDAGVKVIPAPANYYIKHGSVKNLWSWIPSSENIRMMEAAIHEYVGMVWYRLGGE
jgi:uncharacterized SAM-binding protein YcdF (DUF218 family)